LILLLAGLYFFILGWVVPKAATLTVPGRWNMIPLRQPRTIVRDYLGEPSVPNYSTDSLLDEWAGGSKGKMYFLKIRYAADSTAVEYSIHYKYKSWMASKDYLIDSFSIR
jgi:hypothetical protein